MEGQPQLQLFQPQYALLLAPPQVNSVLIWEMDSKMSHVQDWSQCHDCLTMLRRVTKHNPQCSEMFFRRYEPVLHCIYTRSRPQLLRNLLLYLQELFLTSKFQDVSYAVQSFGQCLLRKAATDIHLKQLIQQTITCIVFNCKYDCTLLIACEVCHDRNPTIVQFALKFFAAVVGNVSILTLQQETLCTMMKTLLHIIQSKRNNVRNVGVDLCIGVCKSMGSENYLQLMAFALKQQEVYMMGNMMESHRVEKVKPQPLASALKKKRMSVNQNYSQNYYHHQ